MFICYSSSLVFFLFFFFKQKTAYEMRISDWSSDVCSSDLEGYQHLAGHPREEPAQPWQSALVGRSRGIDTPVRTPLAVLPSRSRHMAPQLLHERSGGGLWHQKVYGDPGSP